MVRQYSGEILEYDDDSSVPLLSGISPYLCTGRSTVAVVAVVAVVDPGGWGGWVGVGGQEL
jgi:hypothetical protein